jgi:protoporphyrinogen oxidase
VVLIERADRLGGLLASEKGPEGAWFDHGTHIPAETGHPAVDSVLFSEMSEPPWRELGQQLAGNFTFGRLVDGPAPDLRLMPPEVYRQGMVELLDSALEPSPARARSAEDDLLSGFGPTITEHLFRPALRKLLGLELGELAPGAHQLFVSRVIALTGTASKALKQLPELDARLAFHHATEAVSTRRAWYPTEGGCGRWIDDLQRTALADVDVRPSTQVVALRTSGAWITALELTSGEVFETDRLVWTLPSVTLLPLLGRPMPDGMTRPQFVQSDLHHLIFDRPFLTDRHYVACLDPSVDVFRVTLYPNLRGDGASAPYSCTVGVLQPPTRSATLHSPADLVPQLQRIGAVSPDARLVWSRSTSVPMGFPVQTPAFHDDSARIEAAATEGLCNLTLAGRNGSAFFLPDVLQASYEAMRPDPSREHAASSR